MTKPALETLADHGIWNKPIEPKASEYDHYLDICKRHKNSYNMSLRDVDRGMVAMGSSKF